MTEDDKRRAIVAYWVGKAASSLASARSEHAQGRHEFAANRAYYAGFYVASAVMLAGGHRFKKHSGLRAAIHRELALKGLITPELARWYDSAFDARQKSDYGEVLAIDESESRALIEGAEQFVSALGALLPV